MFLIAQKDKHAQGLADLDDTAQGLSLGVQSTLNVHPALNSAKSRRNIHYLQHVDDKRLEDDSLLSRLVPIAGHFTGNVKVFLDQFIALNDQNILNGVTDGASGLASTAVKRDEKLKGLAI